jgi:hypothetical protein
MSLPQWQFNASDQNSTCPRQRINLIRAGILPNLFVTISTQWRFEQEFINNSFLKIMYRVSPLWTSKSQHTKYVGNPQHSDAPVYRRHRDRSQQITTSAPSPIISRVSRVMQTDSSDSLLHLPPPPAPQRLQHQHKLPDEETVVRVYQVRTAEMSADSCSKKSQ